MKNLLNYLNQLGFSNIEARIYLQLLKSGPLTVAELAEKTKINRTATYSYITSLLEKGIIAKVQSNANKISANPPEHLQYLVEQKITSAMSLKETLPNVVDTLNASFPVAKNLTNSEIKYYKGRTGVKKIYEECFKTDILRTYFNAGDVIKVFPENQQLFINKITNDTKIAVFEILEFSIEAFKKMEPYENISRHSHKILPKDVKLTANDILIYDGKVAIINIGDKNNITGVVLENRDYYNNSVQLFDLLWRFLPEPKNS